MNRDEQKDFFNRVADILLWCFFLSIALVIFWFVFYLTAGGRAYGIHSRWFELSRHDFDLMFYYAMAFVKVCSIVCFLLPYIAIKLTVRKIEKVI